MFSCIAWLSKQPDPYTFNAATNFSKGTGWYYRDAIAAAAAGKLIRFDGAKRVTTPTALVYRAGTTALTSGVFTTLTPDTMRWDNNQFWNPTSNPERITFKSAGLYLIGGYVEFNAVTGGRRYVQISANNTTPLVQQVVTVANANATRLSLSTIYYFAANDFIEIDAQATVAGVTVALPNFWVVGIVPET